MKCLAVKLLRQGLQRICVPNLPQKDPTEVFLSEIITFC